MGSVTMNEHPTIEDLQRFRSGQIEGDAVLAMGRHLASCSACVTKATQHLGLERTANALLDDFARDNVAPFDAAAKPVRLFSWPVLAAAASVAIAVISLLLWPDPAKPPAPARHRPVIRTTTPPTTTVQPPRPRLREEWTDLMDRMRGGAPIPMPPALRAIRPEEDILRGSASTNDHFKPSGVVIRTTRPEMTWPAKSGAESVVQIFHDDEEVMRSARLTTSQWRPSSALARGETYTWQVRVTQGDASEILPASPTPVARFHVIDATTAAELEKAEQRHPDDPLLLGVLLARAGLTDDAREQLERVTDSEDEATATHVLHEIESWNGLQ
jgi:hypothetical protein